MRYTARPTVSGLFADISKAGVETEPSLFEVVCRRKTHGRTDKPGQTHADARVIERSAPQPHTTNTQFTRM